MLPSNELCQITSMLKLITQSITRSGLHMDVWKKFNTSSRFVKNFNKFADFLRMIVLHQTGSLIFTEPPPLRIPYIECLWPHTRLHSTTRFCTIGITNTHARRYGILSLHNTDTACKHFSCVWFRLWASFLVAANSQLLSLCVDTQVKAHICLVLCYLFLLGNYHNIILVSLEHLHPAVVKTLFFIQFCSKVMEILFLSDQKDPKCHGHFKHFFQKKSCCEFN
jgi:hypothetical protein